MAHANWVIGESFNEVTLRSVARKKECSTQELVTVGRYPAQARGGVSRRQHLQERELGRRSSCCPWCILPPPPTPATPQAGRNALYDHLNSDPLLSQISYWFSKTCQTPEAGWVPRSRTLQDHAKTESRAEKEGGSSGDKPEVTHLWQLQLFSLSFSYLPEYTV